MNNEKYDDWFNEAFDEAFDRAANTTSSVNHDTKRESWLQVKQQIAARSKQKKRWRRFQYAGIIAASMAMGAIVFSPPTISQAVTPIYQQIKDWGDGIVTIISGKNKPSTETTTPKTNPPPDTTEKIDNLGEKLLWSSSSADFDYTLDEVLSRITFPYTEFGYFPKEYQFSDVYVAPENDTAPIYNMIVQYVSSEGKLLNVKYTDLETGEVAVSTLSSPNAETLYLKSGIEAIYTRGPSSADSLQFNHNNVLIHINGELSKKELLKIANSLP